MDEEISIRSTDETQVKQIMEEVVTGNIGENPYTSIPTLTCIICDSAINNSNWGMLDMQQYLSQPMPGRNKWSLYMPIMQY